MNVSKSYSLDLQKDSSVAQKMQNSDWANSFRRLPRGGVEECQWYEYTQMLSSVVMSLASDRWAWSLNGKGVFSVKSAREEIDKHLLVTSSSPTR
nr:RNA-directed DNA polymerase, eukaryota, reverse transcriptase zinc-binding domain protein [Tanacetum cinerariifolium]